MPPALRSAFLPLRSPRITTTQQRGGRVQSIAARRASRDLGQRVREELLPAAAQVAQIPLAFARLQDPRARALAPAQLEVRARAAFAGQRVVLVQTELELLE